jgi:Adenylate and Guanylate cyclase catalytic domain
VLFVDLVEVTARSDRADPEDIRDTLELYHSVVRRCIEEYGGVVEKFIGDAVMAVFGAPVSHGDDVERAVRAGFRVFEDLAELNEARGLDLAARAAVTTGEAVVTSRCPREAPARRRRAAAGRGGGGHPSHSTKRRAARKSRLGLGGEGRAEEAWLPRAAAGGDRRPTSTRR